MVIKMWLFVVELRHDWKCSFWSCDNQRVITAIFPLSSFTLDGERNGWNTLESNTDTNKIKSFIHTCVPSSAPPTIRKPNPLSRRFKQTVRLTEFTMFPLRRQFPTPFARWRHSPAVAEEPPPPYTETGMKSDAAHWPPAVDEHDVIGSKQDGGRAGLKLFWRSMSDGGTKK